MLRLGFWLVLQSKIVMFGILIYRRLQNGLASCRTDISDHASAEQLEGELWVWQQFPLFYVPKEVDNFTWPPRPVARFSCFVS